MGRVDCLPFEVRVTRSAVGDVRSGGTKIAAEIIHHFTEAADLMEKLGSLGEQHPAIQTVEKRRSLAPGALEIGGIEGSCVGNRTVMLGVFTERPQQGYQGVRKPIAKIRSDTDRLA